MGNTFTLASITTLWRPSSSTAPSKVILLGLDASGKTTILYRMKEVDVPTTIPTIGFNVESCRLEGFEFTAWDLGGRDKTRAILGRYHIPGSDALIFVVDANDIGSRMDQARDEFYRMIGGLEEAKELPVLLLANKQDLPGAMTPEDLENFFRIDTLKTRVKLFGCSAKSNNDVGLKEGLRWLEQAISNKQKRSSVKGTGMENGETQRLDYDPTAKGKNATLEHFRPVQQGSFCPFAKTAKLWGGRAMDKNLSIEEKASSHAKALTAFAEKVRGSYDHAKDKDNTNRAGQLDGFCIELDDPLALGQHPEDLGKSVYEMLTAISDLDPRREKIMRVSYIGSRGWRFRFNGMDFFVTTFAPCYPKSSSRYAFGTQRAFLLLQPEVSFARHNLPKDTPETEWEDPKTIRDKVRVAFQKAGQSYHIPQTVFYPAAEHIVKPLYDDGNAVVRWWKHNGNFQKTRL